MPNHPDTGPTTGVGWHLFYTMARHLAQSERFQIARCKSASGAMRLIRKLRCGRDLPSCRTILRARVVNVWRSKKSKPGPQPLVSKSGVGLLLENVKKRGF